MKIVSCTITIFLPRLLGKLMNFLFNGTLNIFLLILNLNFQSLDDNILFIR